MYVYIKRAIDLIFASIFFLFFVLLILMVGPIIIFTDFGPIFYNASRLGKKNKLFKMYKFRTMYKNSPDIRNLDGSTYNAVNDSRITPIGKFLRKTSLDEIPQILNVIKGDMSFIGPRPDLPDAVKIYEGNESRRNEVRPGISGYSQAYYRNNQELHERFKTDIFYVDHISLLLDIKIFFRTIVSVLGKKDIYRNQG